MTYAGVDFGYRPPPVDMSTSFRTAAAASLPRVTGMSSGMNQTMATTPWNGRRRFPTPTARSGLVGMSYVGVTQMLTAITSPPHLAGIMPVITGSNYHENWTYQGGALEQSFDQGWSTYFAADTLDRRATKAVNVAHADQLLPLGDFPVLIPGSPSGLADYYLDWLAHPSYDGYWKQWSIEENYAKIKVPGFHVAAWYDLFQDGTIRNYEGIKAQGGSELARNNQKLLVFVGGHAGLTAKIGDIDFGKDSVPDLRALTLRWYDHVLKGIDNGIDREKPVKIFVMGRNTWREEDGWPLARARETRYYLHSGGKANTLSGDGTLSNEPPVSEPPDEYVYDPANPVPTRGGPVPVPPQSGGPVDQRPNETRNDVLVYTTPAFSQDTEITADHLGALRQLLRRGYGFYRQAHRRLAGRESRESDRWNFARPLSPFYGKGRTYESRREIPTHHQPLVNLQRLPEGPQVARGGLQQ